MERDRFYIDNEDVVISGTNVWMTYGEIVGLFNVTVGAVIRSVKKVLREGGVERIWFGTFG